MENYIVRIYRRESDNTQKVTGLVEIVETSEIKPFIDLDELKEILGRSTRIKSEREKYKD